MVQEVARLFAAHPLTGVIFVAAADSAQQHVIGRIQPDDEDQAVKLKDALLRKEISQDEFNSKYELLDSSRETVIRALRKGILEINDNNEFILKLINPIEVNGKIEKSELVFKNRYQVKDIQSKLKGMDTEDLIGMQVAFLSALTNTSKQMLLSLYNRDFKVCGALVVLFQRAD